MLSRSICRHAFTSPVLLLIYFFCYSCAHNLSASSEPLPVQTQPDVVNGNLIQFNDNGAWTWYSDERTVLDAARGRLIVGSVACQAGVGGASRQGDVETVIYALYQRHGQRFVLKKGSSNPRAFVTDDHNTPAFVVLPAGKVVAWYSAHNAETRSYWRVCDGSQWQDEHIFDWTSLPHGTDFRATYSNPHYLAGEKLAYNFVRANDHGSPNILVSADGENWRFAGQLTTSLTNINVGYVSGYFKYCDNGRDRIDFIGTETHPRDSSTSMYHGYIKQHQSFRSDGTIVDTNIFDQTAPFITQFTKIFTNGTVWPPGQTNYRCWNDDLQRFDDGTVEAVIVTRINEDTRGSDSRINPNHAFFFCRFDGSNWTSTYLCHAGYKLYSSEADYVGLGCLSPNDPDTIFISTSFDPTQVRPGAPDNALPSSRCREIWKGVTHNHGATFTWTPVTQNSTHDNLRPIVTAAGNGNNVLLWFRATYSSAQKYDAAPVGLLDWQSESAQPKTVVLATTNNTRLASGAALVPADEANHWHARTFGARPNSSPILASADTSAEDAPRLVTKVKVTEPGIFDLWALFWCSTETNADWRIVAGLSTNQMQVYRQLGCQTIHPTGRDFDRLPTTDGTNFLYQAYMGRVTASTDGTMELFIDDLPVKAGSIEPLVADKTRTWYQGVAYSRALAH